MSLTFTKISILLQYYRIFPMRNVRRAIYASMFIIIAFGVQVFFTTLFACIPIRAFWEVAIQQEAKCLPKFPYVTIRIKMIYIQSTYHFCQQNLVYQRHFWHHDGLFDYLTTLAFFSSTEGLQEG